MAFSVRDVPTFLKSSKTDARALRLRRDLGAAAGFDSLYTELHDPWRAESDHRSSYQRRKNLQMIELLPAGRFDAALDLGCGLGDMTRLLAERAETVVGCDIAASAVERARRASQHLPQVAYLQADILNLPAHFYGRFDLVVVADVLYYADLGSETALKSAAHNIVSTLKPGGHCLLADHYFAGLDRDSRESVRIHDAFRWSASLTHKAQRRGWFYIADLLQKMM